MVTHSERVEQEPQCAAFVASQKKETAPVKAALLTALATPGVVGGKQSRAWAQGMLSDANEDLAMLESAGLKPLEAQQ